MRDKIKEIAESLSQPVAFFDGNLYSVNADMDNARDSEGKDIFFVYIQPTESSDDIDIQGLIHETRPVEFYIMKKLNFPTAEYKSSEVEPYINQMLELAREFVHSLNHDDIVDKSGSTSNANGITGVKYTHEYGYADIHLFGVGGKMDVPINEGKTGCVVQIF